jgi:hypothetical protein
MKNLQTGYGGSLSGSIIGEIGSIVTQTPPDRSSDPLSLFCITDGNQWASKTLGNKDGGEVTVTCKYDQHQHQLIFNQAGNQASRQQWTMTTPEGSTYVFQGLIARCQGSPMESATPMTYDWVIAVDGEPVFSSQAQASSSPSSTPSASPSASPSA